MAKLVIRWFLQMTSAKIHLNRPAWLVWSG